MNLLHEVGLVGVAVNEDGLVRTQLLGEVQSGLEDIWNLTQEVSEEIQIYHKFNQSITVLVYVPLLVAT